MEKARVIAYTNNKLGCLDDWCNYNLRPNTSHFTVAVIVLKDDVIPFLNLIAGKHTLVKVVESIFRGTQVIIIDASYEQWQQIILLTTKEQKTEMREILNSVFLPLSETYNHIKKTKQTDGTFICQL